MLVDLKVRDETSEHPRSKVHLHTSPEAKIMCTLRNVSRYKMESLVVLPQYHTVQERANLPAGCLVSR